MVERREITNWYIKDTGDHASYMSGLPIPHDADGVTRNINFVNCHFHYSSYGIFENCAVNGQPIPNGKGCLKQHELAQQTEENHDAQE